MLCSPVPPRRGNLDTDMIQREDDVKTLTAGHLQAKAWNRSFPHSLQKEPTCRHLDLELPAFRAAWNWLFIQGVLVALSGQWYLQSKIGKVKFSGKQTLRRRFVRSRFIKKYPWGVPGWLSWKSM
ncbi:uncharacterized protein LOC144296010 isoform X1 [Canis aureus]